MKVLIDPTIFGAQKFGGISRYFTEVYRILKQNNKIDISCPLYYTENYHLKHYKLSSRFYEKVLKIKGIQRFCSKATLLNKNISKTLSTLRKKKTDLFVPTYFDPYFLNDIGDIPFVLTVYDMIYEVLPQYFQFDKETVPNKRLLMGKAKKIIAISKNTKADIIKFYPEIPADKIEVVYLSHSIEPDHQTKVPAIAEGKKYILYVGNRYAYKNYNWLVNALQHWLKENEVSLICLGAGPFTSDEEKQLRDFGIRDKVLQYDFEDHELAAFYSNAEAFIFPSQYEGFGIPVLEAMYCGCPVLLPEISSFPEVAGNAGVYFDLNNSNTLTESLSKVLYDKDFRKNIIDAGVEQSKKFSWQSTADSCLKVFKDAVQ